MEREVSRKRSTLGKVDDTGLEAFRLKLSKLDGGKDRKNKGRSSFLFIGSPLADRNGEPL